MEFNARVEAAQPPRPDLVDQVLDTLAGHGPAVGLSLRQRLEVTITLNVVDLRTATLDALALTTAAGLTPTAIEVLPTAEFDRRTDGENLPPLLSVAEAAQQLSISPQAVAKRISSGLLPARQIGRTWVIPAAALQ